MYNVLKMHESKLFRVPNEPARPQVPNNLLVQPTRLIGREAELEAACLLLRGEDTQEPDVRLLSLVGPGGVGKTRLALQVAEELLEEYRDGVYFVDLAPVSDPALVVSTIAATLEVSETSRTRLLTTLKEHLRDKSVLLVLDNFEQIMPAGTMVGELLASCPDLKVIITSRSALRLRAEYELAVAPLALPEAARRLSVSQLSKYAAVALFVQRARAVKSDFELTESNASAVVEVCRRVDGLPLAIELVAAHARLLSPQAILARLRHPLVLLKGRPQEAPGRHHTMRDTIEWSYKLLEESQQRLFRRMSVFVGGCSLRVAEAVCNEEGDILVDIDNPLALDVLEDMEALVDKSLVRRLEDGADSEPRLTMLATVREYAIEQLEASGESETMYRRHADYYVVMSRQFQPTLDSKDVSFWMARLGPEHGNLRAALGWLLERDDPADHETALKLILDLQELWGRYHNTSEVSQWLETVFSKLGSNTTLLRVAALRYASRLAYLQADYERASTLAEEGLAGARTLNDVSLIAASLNMIGLMDIFQGKYEQARALLEEALEIYRRLGDQIGVGAACINLGEIVRYQGDFARAESYYRESLDIFRALGSKGGILQALSNIGHVVYMQGDLEEARAIFVEALTLAHEMDARKIAAEVLTGMSSVIMAEARGDRGTETPLPRGLISGEAPVPPGEGITKAVKILGITSAIVERSGRQLEPIDQEEFDRNLASARAALGEQAFDIAWEEGRGMNIEQAIDLAGRSIADAQPPVGKSTTRYPGGLTRREVEVTALVARGLTNEAIAHQLVLSERTIEMHVSHALHRLGLTTRTQLTAWAMHGNLAPGTTED